MRFLESLMAALASSSTMPLDWVRRKGEDAGLGQVGEAAPELGGEQDDDGDGGAGEDPGEHALDVLEVEPLGQEQGAQEGDDEEEHDALEDACPPRSSDEIQDEVERNGEDQDLGPGFRISKFAESSHQVGHTGHVGHFADVVDADDISAAEDRDSDGRSGTAHAIVHATAESPADEAFARGPDRERAPQTAELVQTPQDLQIVLRRLAEADPRSRIILSRSIPALNAILKISRKNPEFPRRRSPYAGLRCIVRGVPFMCMRMTATPAPAAARGHRRIAAQGGDVVEDLRPPRPERRPRDGGLGGVDRDEDLSGRQPVDHRDDAADLLGGAGPRGRPAGWTRRRCR